MAKLRCYTCGGNHTCRQCPIEQKISGHMKEVVGKTMEKHIAKEVCCPRCNKNSLSVLGNNSPSLDIICTECDINIECKSKCLSVDRLPKDIILNAGSYIDYQQRQEKGLDFIVVIYKIDRRKKHLIIRKILYITDEYIKRESDNFTVSRKHGTSLSNIFIKDHTILDELDKGINCVFSFKKYFDSFIKNMK
jgi:hypothetical protein